ncbi:uncharacterized protein EDB91DRAFT_471105 [Suillus paluster]|uniref:uncharacterized protein n=1 Tax=Suillus paluster TaxID=48578 RepID=UPI001B86425B|nr:uncharacterized protein EDB91DRAFT_471105 [Suillus paluster]KAG1737839.1 hypothetical protein EDB91DRAFT_471105 [Suillus paluster]
MFDKKIHFFATHSGFTQGPQFRIVLLRSTYKEDGFESFIHYGTGFMNGSDSQDFLRTGDHSVRGQDFADATNKPAFLAWPTICISVTQAVSIFKSRLNSRRRALPGATILPTD